MHAYFFKTRLQVLDAEDPNIQRWTLLIPGSKTLICCILFSSMISRFEHRFSHFVAPGTCLDTHACCRTPISCFTPCIAYFPVVFRLGLVFHRMSLFALHCFLRHFDFSPTLHLGQWCLLSGVLTNQGPLGLEHWQRCWAYRLHV